MNHARSDRGFLFVATDDSALKVAHSCHSPAPILDTNHSKLTKPLKQSPKMTSTSQTTPPAAQQASDGHPRGAMFIPDEMLKGLIDQANRELSSSDYYLSFALWFADNEMEGSAVGSGGVVDYCTL